MSENEIMIKCEFCGKEISLSEAKSHFGYPLCEECFFETIGGY